MSGFFPRLRFVFVLLSVAVLIAAYLSLGETQNRAQERAVAPAVTAPKAKFQLFSRSDEVTSDIRNRSKEIVRVEFRSITDRDKVAKYGRVVEDFGSFVGLAKNKTTDMSRSGLDVQRIETTINLPGAKFEPVEVAPAETIRTGDSASDERGYYIVQFGGIVTDEWLDS